MKLHDNKVPVNEIILSWKTAGEAAYNGKKKNNYPTDLLRRA